MIRVPQDHPSNITTIFTVDFRITVVSPAYSRGPLTLDRAGYLMERGDVSGPKDSNTRVYA